ncbi:MAG TPA: DUF4142 domain-containing protein [Chitinophagaceae bacterium]|jgi:putative membrane protein|nr:DUF4142 domain-containing protein [Chitinophagaceae bacterium]
MKVTLATLGLACLISFGAAAQQTSESTNEARSSMRLGRMTVSAFQEINAKGTQMVNAIRPSSGTLSAADLALLQQVAMGGMRQLAISQAVLGKATNEQVRLLAQSEVEEQTNVAAKLKEIAAAKGASLPDAPDAATTALVARINNASAEEVNMLYLQEGGINGHMLLQETMKTVNRNAADDDLEDLAEATLPVIKTHLKVSRKVQKAMPSAR